jgi:hypothetical protein
MSKTMTAWYVAKDNFFDLMTECYDGGDTAEGRAAMLLAGEQMAAAEGVLTREDRIAIDFAQKEAWRKSREIL